MQRIKKRYRKWKIWCRYAKGSKTWKLMVFLGLVKSSWFDIFTY